ncbi:MAG: hypothetical protein IKN43_12155 [Selenomonadaceae bacterium]|nr:hypothetical protein [Selenomonadaceae bacterium]
MRITYYCFPKEMPLKDRAFAYFQDVEGREDLEEIAEELVVTPDEKIEDRCPMEVECSVSMAKKLLKAYGGEAYTQHFERDGGLFETTPVTLKGNNSRFKYNRHL